MFKINQKGQTLIEVMVAMFILTIGIVAILNWGISSLTLSGTMKDRIIALNLAREGLEIMHSIRDTNLVSNTSGDCWATTAGNYCGLIRGSWNVDKDTVILPCRSYTLGCAKICTGIGSCNLEAVLVAGNFSHYKTSDTEQKFKRGVAIEFMDINSVKITSQVQWIWHGIEQNIFLSEVLTNWR